MASSSPQKTRRGFLREVLFGWFFLTILPAFYVLAEYLYPRTKKDAAITDLPIAKLTEVPLNSFKIIRLKKKPIMVMNSEQAQVKAFSLICTHLGCVVEYREEEQKFHCNCHGSVFDKDGKNLSGPAPTPLKPYRVKLTSTDILISEG
ncbi:MAG: ubiquinol-cytochrome c reductase iron-sulfur subunit [Ignavibacteriae bacterium]|nr:ubiquinol-cytochrome c reductase iron-sulfur subunit [Ignavibacteriota bacterium]